MKYVLITRMYTGLFESIKEYEWNPTGIPTITNLVERLATNGKLLFWFILCKNKAESLVVQNKLSRLTFKNENHIKAIIIPYKHIVNSEKVNSFVNNIYAFCYIVKVAGGLGSKICYFDRSNIILAGLIKTIFRSFTVIRILGVYPNQKKLAVSSKSKLLHPLTFLSYKIKHDLAICTQDGSGVEYYAEKLLNKRTKINLLINGIEKDQNCLKINNRPAIISFLFVGKIIKDKGILELIEVFSMLRQNRNDFKLKVVGKGELSKTVVDLIKKLNLEGVVQMIGSVDRRTIHQLHNNSDVYISLNKLGNLSNTVLEAMAAGKCIVMLGKDEKEHTDISTEKLVPDNAVIRINRSNIVKDLNQKIEDLLDHPEEISIYSNRMKTFASRILWTWDERINSEIEFIEKYAKGEFNLKND